MLFFEQHTIFKHNTFSTYFCTKTIQPMELEETVRTGTEAYFFCNQCSVTIERGNICFLCKNKSVYKVCKFCNGVYSSCSLNRHIKIVHQSSGTQPRKKRKLNNENSTEDYEDYLNYERLESNSFFANNPESFSITVSRGTASYIVKNKKMKKYDHLGKTQKHQRIHRVKTLMNILGVPASDLIDREKETKALASGKKKEAYDKGFNRGTRSTFNQVDNHIGSVLPSVLRGVGCSERDVRTVYNSIALECKEEDKRSFPPNWDLPKLQEHCSYLATNSQLSWTDINFTLSEHFDLNYDVQNVKYLKHLVKEFDNGIVYNDNKRRRRLKFNGCCFRPWNSKEKLKQEVRELMLKGNSVIKNGVRLFYFSKNELAEELIKNNYFPKTTLEECFWGDSTSVASQNVFMISYGYLQASYINRKPLLIACFKDTIENISTAIEKLSKIITDSNQTINVNGTDFKLVPKVVKGDLKFIQIVLGNAASGNADYSCPFCNYSRQKRTWRDFIVHIKSLSEIWTQKKGGYTRKPPILGDNPNENLQGCMKHLVVVLDPLHLVSNISQEIRSNMKKILSKDEFEKVRRNEVSALGKNYKTSNFVDSYADNRCYRILWASYHRVYIPVLQKQSSMWSNEKKEKCDFLSRTVARFSEIISLLYSETSTAEENIWRVCRMQVNAFLMNYYGSMVDEGFTQETYVHAILFHMPLQCSWISPRAASCEYDESLWKPFRYFIKNHYNWKQPMAETYILYSKLRELTYSRHGFREKHVREKRFKKICQHEWRDITFPENLCWYKRKNNVHPALFTLFDVLHQFQDTHKVFSIYKNQGMQNKYFCIHFSKKTF
eukprot:gb/GECH01010424.1/.p1 GENE.gb/GECH01010424.1/~~gb/GECH01010424.1/.p1  ORF type:complete len:835 (+),score=31.76 gb/GECH01010424.1/:1-2505(+)